MLSLFLPFMRIMYDEIMSFEIKYISKLLIIVTSITVVVIFFGDVWVCVLRGPV